MNAIEMSELAAKNRQQAKSFQDAMVSLQAFSEKVIAKAINGLNEPLPDEYECVMFGIYQDSNNPLKLLRQCIVNKKMTTNQEQEVVRIDGSGFATLDLNSGRWVICIGDC
ncbi:MAG: hypothetical protein Q8Q03_01190 [bacterium]|nr:hypothetical protein [bacterium]